MIQIVISILFTIVLLVFRKTIKKHSIWVYLISSIIGIFFSVIFINFYDLLVEDYAKFYYLFSCFESGYLGSIILFLVMFTGVFTRRSPIGKKLYFNRGEFSIFASILLTPHLSYYSYLFFTEFMADFDPEILNLREFFIYITGFLLLILHTPLFITSFYFIRKRMSNTTWKNIQKLAYPFYFLMFVHIILTVFELKFTENGLKTTFYTLFFAVYIIFKIRKLSLNEIYQSR
ncbi:MAG: ferric reductase-like transmembrane domain-containing protein [Candidatus Delongbacteria bacterium]|nr:ferric reductase-like transmembrane domain-containing protein [Candidatus Delongbacteria bacterium]MBN2833475.1 ferric reductase-like transmembrane domain-containing protein [Candidatus Delongbacteria bacterium]